MNVLSTECAIRSLRSDDWEKFKELRLASLKECPIAYGISIDDEVDYTDQYWQKFCHDAEHGLKKWHYVAESPDGELIGMLGAVELFGALMTHQVEIVQAYVMPQYRRQYVMENLFFSLKNELKKVPHLEQMIVWVTLHETQVACTMLEKWGFIYAGQLNRTVKYNGKYYDCCWLEAPL